MSFKKKTYREQLELHNFISSVVDKVFTDSDDDPITRKLLEAKFSDRLIDHIAIATIEIANEQELQALNDFKLLVYKIAPHLQENEIVLEFLLNYENLRNKVFATIPSFADAFINICKQEFYYGK